MRLNSFAPIILFAYNRPILLKQTLEALEKNTLADKSILYIFCDGPMPTASESERKKIKEAREIANMHNWCKRVIIHESDTNLGLAQSVINGISTIINRHGKAIILEDDLVTSKYFLQFLNDALELYADNEQVISVSAYSYPAKKLYPELFFLQTAHCLGWATWKRGWELFEPDIDMLLTGFKSKEQINRFNFNGKYPGYGLLERQKDGRIDSWALRWSASAFLKGKFTLFSGKNMVSHIGYEDSTHKYSYKRKTEDIYCGPVKVELIPMEESKRAFHNFGDYLYRTRLKKPFHIKLKLFIIRLLPKKVYWYIKKLLKK